ncbi:hypothetical protein C0993_003417, partial [Termitomyces sp. T159_Od127]
MSSDQDHYNLRGYLAEHGVTFEIMIRPNQSVDKLKKLVKEEQKEGITCDASNLQIYKLNEETITEKTLLQVEEKGLPDNLVENPPTAQNMCKLKGSKSIGKCWSKQPEQEEKVHFMVVVPEGVGQSGPVVPLTGEQINASIAALAKSLGRHCEAAHQNDTITQQETLETFGRKFPLQQSTSILRSLQSHMLDSFRFKFVDDREWLKKILIPIVGAASGTGKTTLCTRFLEEIAVRAQENSPPTKSSPVNEIQLIIAASENHLPPVFDTADLPLHFSWSEERLADFRRKVTVSSGRRLTLTVDLYNSTFNFSDAGTLEKSFAAAILDAYANRYRDQCSSSKTWLAPEELLSKFLGHGTPVHSALRVLRHLEKDNIIIIHVDETQEPPLELLHRLIKVLVKEMHYAKRNDVPWIFPIFSGLSLTSLLESAKMSGVRVKRYTPPVLTISSMLNITRTLLYPNTSTEQPVFPKGFIKLLHDIRGPTRYFQSSLLFIQNRSEVVRHQIWSLDATINPGAIRAGLERQDQDWSVIFDKIAEISRDTNFMRDLQALRDDVQLLIRLFDLNVLGKEISVNEKFMIAGRSQPLSTLLEYGWVNIVDAEREGNCRVFLPFLTLYGARRDDEYSEKHPGFLPLCKTIDPHIVGEEDARMLQYRLIKFQNSQKLNIRLSNLFGDLGDVVDHSFELSPHDCKFRSCAKQYSEYRDILSLWDCQDSSTVYLNAPLARFADSFALLKQSNSTKPFVLCLQSKFFQKTELQFGMVKKEFDKISAACSGLPFCLVIPADRVSPRCRESLAAAEERKSQVLLLDDAGFDFFF